MFEIGFSRIRATSRLPSECSPPMSQQLPPLFSNATCPDTWRCVGAIAP